jgi:hypothetical protein
MNRKPVHDAMREAREAIRTVGPGLAGSGLSLDLRAALLNLDAALARALSDVDGNLGAGADQLEVYSRLTTVREAAESESTEAAASVKAIVNLLERRGSRRLKEPRTPRTIGATGTQSPPPPSTGRPSTDHPDSARR